MDYMYITWITGVETFKLQTSTACGYSS